ncbi:MAG: hypothetical protein ACTSPX_01180 [Candidatus Thorarchaeota archaeon]
MLDITVTPKAVLSAMHDGTVRHAKDLTHWLITQSPTTEEQLKDTFNGDCAENNLGLAIFERALDWRIGSTVFDFIRAVATQYHALPRTFRVTYDARKDQLLIHLPSGRAFDEHFREVVK